jgi:hypothetical protein
MLAGCVGEVPPEQIALDWPEGLLKGYTNLKSECYAVEDDVVRYAYQLPPGVGVDAAMERLRMQIQRSGYRTGAPRESCFEVLEEASDQLVMRCFNAGNHPRDVWSVRIQERTVTVIAGTARAVLTYRVCA